MGSMSDFWPPSIMLDGTTLRKPARTVIPSGHPSPASFPSRLANRVWTFPTNPTRISNGTSRIHPLDRMYTLRLLRDTRILYPLPLASKGIGRHRNDLVGDWCWPIGRLLTRHGTGFARLERHRPALFPAFLPASRTKIRLWPLRHLHWKCFPIFAWKVVGSGSMGSSWGAA
jgi:hypothetical protein